MNKKYEKTINIDYLFRIFIRHWKMLLFMFLVGIILGMTLSFSNNKKTYYSNGTLYNSSLLGQQHYNNIKVALTKSDFIESVVLSLDDLDIKHYDGGDITKKDIVDGVVFPTYITSSQSAYYSLQFKSEDSSIVVPVLSNYLEIAVENLNTSGGFPNISVSELPENTFTYKSNLMKNLILSFVISAAFSYLISLIYDYITNYVYDKNQVLEMNCNAFEVFCSKKVKTKEIENQFSSFCKLINSKYSPSIIGICSPNSVQDSLTVSDYIINEFNKNEKVLFVFINSNETHNQLNVVDIKIDLIDNKNVDNLRTTFENYQKEYSRIIICFNPLSSDHSSLLFCRIIDIMIISARAQYTTCKNLYNALVSIKDTGFENVYSIILNDITSYKDQKSYYLSRFEVIDI